MTTLRERIHAAPHQTVELTEELRSLARPLRTEADLDPHSVPSWWDWTTERRRNRTFPAGGCPAVAVLKRENEIDRIVQSLRRNQVLS